MLLAPTTIMTKARLPLAAAALLLPAIALSAAESPQFNRDVRPILSDRCFSCHGPDPGNRKSKLRLDVEAVAKSDLGKGRFGIVPGDPARSEIYKRITTANKALRMPPAYAGHAALTESEIAALKRWIEDGAVYQPHWSFLPPVRPAGGIDALVRDRLRREGLKPSPEADRATLLRRVTFDLTGLPPTPDEVDTFVQDRSPNAYEKVVDRLLASPRYAERMAWRWMEAARYADTNGYQMDGPRDMWRWRDWVLEAFRDNMRYDRFTIEQIAGDLLPNATLDQRIATGFHRNHRTNAEGGIVPEEFRVEYVADRTETTSTVWLGLTMGCARCHDHKYDPMTQRDFYSLFAFFNNVPERGLVYNFGNEEPYIKAPTREQRRQWDAHDVVVKQAQAAWAAVQGKLNKAQSKWEKGLRDESWTVRDGLVFEASGKGEEPFEKHKIKFDHTSPFTFAAWVKPASPKGAILSISEDYFEGQGHGLYLIDGKLRLHIIFRWTDIGMRVETQEPVALGKWQHVAATYDGKRKPSGVRLFIDGKPQKLKVLFDDLAWPMDFKFPVRVGAGGGLGFDGEIEDARIYKAALTEEQVSTLPLRGKLRESVAAKKQSPEHASKLRLAFLDTALPEALKQSREALRKAEEEREKFIATVPTVMVMEEGPKRQAFLLKRGAYDAPGEKVEPGVPAFLPPLPEGVALNRLSLARWLVDRKNPLTARVAVNRFWQMLFGTGLVKTVEDFGSQGEWPIYQDVLDWLAVEFMDSGWDVKHILKTIVMSGTYRQSSRPSPELVQRDPENRLLARGPRLRLSTEMVRDQALAVSGLLVEKLGGPSVKPYQPPGLWQELHGGKGYVQDKGEGLYRRSLYTYWKRTVAPPSMVTFDSPTREACTVRESRTNTPLQALNLMNDVTYLEAARKLGERMLTEGGDRGLARGWKLVLAREPSPKERQLTRDALEKFAAYYRQHPSDAEKYLSQGESRVNRSLDPKQLAAYASVASMLLNLDEAVTKE